MKNNTRKQNRIISARAPQAKLLGYLNKAMLFLSLTLVIVTFTLVTYRNYLDIGFNSLDFLMMLASLLGSAIFGRYLKYFIENYTHKKNSIEKINIYKLMHIVKFIYSVKTVEKIFQPIASDWEREYFEALHEKAHWKARWINMCYWLTFLGTMLAHAVSTVGRKVRNIWQLTGGG